MDTKIVAHRGASFALPENTIAAFDQACALNVDGIEFDVQLSNDEKVIVFHDPFLVKAGLPKNKVGELKGNTLTRLDVGSWFGSAFANQKMPLLSNMLQKYAHKTTLLIEIKADEHDLRHDLLVDRTVRLIEEANVIEQCYLLSFNHNVLRRALNYNANIRAVLNVHTLHTNAPKLDDMVAGLTAISIDVQALDDKTAEWVRRHDKKLMVWNCDSDGAVEHAYNQKADYIMTDNPAWLQQKRATLQKQAA